MLVMSLCATHLEYCAAVYSSLDSWTSAMPRVALMHVLSSTTFLSFSAEYSYFALVLFFKIALNNSPPFSARTIKLVPRNSFRRGRSSKSFRYRIPQFRHKAFVHCFLTSLSLLGTLFLTILKGSPPFFLSKKAFFFIYLQFNFPWYFPLFSRHDSIISFSNNYFITFLFFLFLLGPIRQKQDIFLRVRGLALLFIIFSLQFYITFFYTYIKFCTMFVVFYILLFVIFLFFC